MSDLCQDFFWSEENVFQTRRSLDRDQMKACLPNKNWFCSWENQLITYYCLIEKLDSNITSTKTLTNQTQIHPWTETQLDHWITPYYTQVQDGSPRVDRINSWIHTEFPYKCGFLKELDHSATKLRKMNIAKKNMRPWGICYNNPDITIKPADKGGSIVIMNTEDCIAEVNRQLSDQEHYKTLDPAITYNKYIHHLIDQAWRMEIIDQTTRENLQTKNPRISSFYLTPKIHKPNNPGRPIGKSIESVTEKISTFVDLHQRTFIPRIPSYVKDTTRFINIIRNIQLEPQDIITTTDVSSLYTNIPHTKGIAAINKMLVETRNDTLLKMFISNLTYQVLTKNYFSFNDQLFEQKQQWELGWHLTMPSFLCTIWKPTS